MITNSISKLFSLFCFDNNIQCLVVGSVNKSFIYFVTGTSSATEKKASPVLKPNFRQRRPRKTGLTTIDFQRNFPELQEEKPTQDETSSPAQKAARC